MSRTPPETFELPVEKICDGYYSDAYFNHTKAVLEDEEDPPRVSMQVFQKHEDRILGGIDEAVAILKLCAGGLAPNTRYDHWVSGWRQLKVYALNEGDVISPFEPVLRIEGPYHLFSHLETVYLGALARRTLIGSNVRDVIAAANGKPIIYMGARHDHWAVQTGDGFAAYNAGVEGVSTDAQASWWGGRGVGTVPHGLIAAYGGDTVKAAAAFAKKFGDQMNVTVLVDFENNCADTACRVASAMKLRQLPLWGVRIDTSESLVDRGLVPHMGQFKPTGVVPELVRHVRAELDRHGHEEIKIIVSGGFSVDKIRRFEREEVPVDAYGVGASLIRGANDFTADVVRIERDGAWTPCGKVGREFLPSDRLELVS